MGKLLCLISHKIALKYIFVLLLLVHLCHFYMYNEPEIVVQMTNLYRFVREYKLIFFLVIINILKYIDVSHQ